MKAMVLKEYGGVEQLELREIAEPRPGPGEVPVKVAATSVNPIDWKLRSGAARAIPAVLGRDVAGEVTEVGQGVTALRLGDQVLGLVLHGYAEKVVAGADAFARLPPGLDLREAAALPLVLLTGAQLIEEAVRPAKGDTVLVTGALGGVGRTAVHVAKLHGARVLAGVRARRTAEAAGLGADQVVAVDDETTPRSPSSRCSTPSRTRWATRPSPGSSSTSSRGGRWAACSASRPRLGEGRSWSAPSWRVRTRSARASW